MKDKTLRNKKIIIRFTADEHQQISAACAALHMAQSNYLRLKIFSDTQFSISDQQDIHTVRIMGILLTKILEKLKDTGLILHELDEIEQLIPEIKMTVRRLNDRLDKV
ncbi:MULTISPECIES: hypothetical protein [Acinetobacter]|uniref:hypothetical protein n=1 Tax=Acinetobacter TaxID=469 RepID=UPI000EA15664|nr:MULTISPECIES: hypothetical protein [Acinetobacter]MDP6003893.1 hypothetical protein [Acinetobacter bereziniae]RKG37338.1 hypothetical protein D7V31_16685 [Acinetobacter sp. WCHAc060007]UUS66846.1 hypothetical protein MST18_16290 [Acinetobacter sp. YH12068_T]WMW76875.1 hypothetical protein RG306_21505 [Acinetobacter bereziniae]